MYLPVAVISLILFASADSTSTSNSTDQANQIVSDLKPVDVGERLKVPKFNKTLHNETDLASSSNTSIHTLNGAGQQTNLSSTLLLNKTADVPLHVEKPVKRPPNLNQCAQQHRVRSVCLQVGSRFNRSRLLVKKSIRKAGKAHTQRLALFTYSIKPKLLKKGYVISYIKVTNKMKLGTEGLVSLVKGGILEKNVVLFMESQKGRKMHFYIEIYVSHLAEIYKNQMRYFPPYLARL